MKSKLILTGMLAVLLVFTMVFAACDTGTNSDTGSNNNSGNNDGGDNNTNPFVGEWSGTVKFEGSDKTLNAEIDITGTKFTFTISGEDPMKGTYTRNGNSVTIKQGSKTIGSASLSKGTLTVKFDYEDEDGNEVKGTGTFTKD